MARITQPIIGITAGEIHDRDHPWSPVVYGQSQTYVVSVGRPGATPLIIPLLHGEAELRKLYDALDGILFAGGNDLAPELYGQKPYPTTKDTSAFRDRHEIQLLKWALGDGKPILGICRGMQLLNVLLGGSLYQDISQDLPGSLDHNQSTKQGTLVDVSHRLRIESDSRLGSILGTATLGTNAHHHQAIRDMGKGIRAVAWTEDGIIEAIELPAHPFALGVQSHPESLEASAEPTWRHMFASFVAAARDYAAQA